MNGEVLSVADLQVSLPAAGGAVHAVRGLSYILREREVLAMVGESGCGKSVSALAVLGLLPPGARVTGSVRYRGEELLGAGRRRLRSLRGRRIALVSQDPMTSLSPAYPVGEQVALAIRAHRDVSRRAALREAAAALDLVGLVPAGDRAAALPHELSGGQRQRVTIAMAIVNGPDVVIADEPTTALDATVQDHVVDTLLRATADVGAALLVITHDLGLVAGIADRVLVMYAGRPVETADVDRLFASPRMPYTVGLLGAVPRPGRESTRLRSIPGQPPSLRAATPGCPFTPRCPLAVSRCAAEPPLVPTDAGGHLAACHRWADVAATAHPETMFDGAAEPAPDTRHAAPARSRP